MVARSGVVFLVSMTDILANPVEICFGSFTATSTTLAAVTSPTASVKAPTMPDTALSSIKKSKTHLPKPYDIVQGMDRVIDMMEETLPDLRKSPAINSRCVAPQNFPFRSAAIQRCVHSSGGEVDPDLIWATTTIWRP
jgi:hypothetical protein